MTVYNTTQNLKCTEDQRLVRSTLAMKHDTKSEDLFSQVCNRHGYTLSKLPTLSKFKQKSPDFRVETPNGIFIAEIKELTPNEKDREQLEAHRLNEVAPTIVTKLGSRCREAIKKACNQLKTYRDSDIPLVVVIYDNVGIGYPMFFTHGAHVDAAMHGDLTVTVPIHKDAVRRPDRNGGGRTTTNSQKQYLSAVLVISDSDDESVLVYHNSYASIPFPLDIFTDDMSTHFTKSKRVHEEPWLWHKMSSSI